MKDGINLEKIGKHKYPLGNQLILKSDDILKTASLFSINSYLRFLIFAPVVTISGDVFHEHEYVNKHNY